MGFIDAVQQITNIPSAFFVIWTVCLQFFELIMLQIVSNWFISGYLEIVSNFFATFKESVHKGKTSVYVEYADTCAYKCSMHISF